MDACKPMGGTIMNEYEMTVTGKGLGGLRDRP